MPINVNNPLLESIYKFVQECLSLVPVIILGSGHSCAFGIPSMAELTEYIRSGLANEIEPEESEIWKQFEEKIKLQPLETVLHEIQLSHHLTDQIIKKTWDCIFPADKKVLENLIQNIDFIPLSKLFHHLFNSTHQRLQLITTNYDCIAEYAADIAGYAWATGFGYGYIRNRYINSSLTIVKGNMPLRMIDCWKVHGSINWYRAPDERIYYLPSLNSPPDNYSPVIITPGIDKYRRTHEEPFRTIMTGADFAIDCGKSFLCIGYGFNDEHIQPKLLDKCKGEGKVIVVLVKKLTETAKRVLLDGRCRHFIALEESDNGTRIFTPEDLDGVVVTDINIWSLCSLLDHIL